MSFTRNLCDDNNGSVDEELGFSSGTVVESTLPREEKQETHV